MTGMISGNKRDLERTQSKSRYANSLYRGTDRLPLRNSFLEHADDLCS